MRKVAAIAIATAVLVPAAPALARPRHHSTAKAKTHCTTVRRGHHARRGVRVCKAKKSRRHTVRARIAIVTKPLPRSATPRSATVSPPTAPQPHFLPPAGPVHCDLFAAPNGSDSQGSGTLTSPFATVRHLDQALSPGETGCLRGGTYGDTGTWQDIATNGTASARITITAYPGESPTVVGWVDVEASYTTVSHLNIDGSNTFYHTSNPHSGCPTTASQGLSISGPDNIFEYNNYYQSVASLRSNGLGIGWTGTPDNTIVRFNKIHDVGQCQDYDHLIYLSHGNNVQIYDNWMWNDHHGWGVQLYPDPSNARVWGNVIDDAGAGFVIGDESGDSVTGNQVFNNVVMNSVGLPTANLGAVAISDYWGGSKGSGNTFTNNVSFNNSGGVSRVSDVTVSGTSTANPRFIDAFSHNYTLQSASPLSGWSMWSGNNA
jgi:hypothetical protein